VRALLLGSDTALGHALLARQAGQGRHEFIHVSRAACRWKSERQAKKSVVRAKCEIVVDLRVEAVGDGGGQLQDLDLKRCHWIGKACQRSGAAYLYVSSSRVFSGQLDRPYRESDDPDNEESVGILMASAEAEVRAACERHLVLRLGPVFSYEGANLITQMLGSMHKGDSLILDDNLRGCPVAADDAARVILALLDQIGTGIEPWGLYHYGSADSATYYEFAEALLASASQFFEFGASAVQLEREPEGLRPLNRSLDCGKIRDTFAVRQVSWRSVVGDIVKHYYEQLAGEQ